MNPNETVDITKLSTTELKAMLFDNMMAAQAINKNIDQLNFELSKKLAEELKPKT